MASPIFLRSYQIIYSNLSDNGWVPILGKKIFYHSISQCTELNYVRLSVVTLNNLRLYHMSKDTTQCNVDSAIKFATDENSEEGVRGIKT